LTNFDTYFLMGTDEHSTNVEKEAMQRGEDPQVYCDRMAAEFEKVWAKLHISYDQFVRTTDPSHTAAVQELFTTIHNNGYIYSGLYKGLYCVSCEEFVVEKDLIDGKCPRHLQPPEQIEETNYFFALSKFSDALKKHIEANPEFIQPDMRRNEILNVIEQGLEDVSVSRAGKQWGVPLPMAEDQVVYVWFDALINYISALGFAVADKNKYERYWPADCHIIGKDITRFHCLIWPAMLMAAGVPLPRCVFGHGFVYSKGTKMSKTLGNIVDPLLVADFFGADVLRYLLLRGIAFNRDGDFTAEQSITRYNAELANELGNLFSRALSMVKRYQNGEVPEWTPPAAEDFRRLTEGVVDLYEARMEQLSFDEALDAMWKAVSAANRFVEEKKPWELSRAEDKGPLRDALRTLLEVLRMSSVLCIPVMPVKAAEMRRQLGLTDDIAAIRIDEARDPGDVGWKLIGDISPIFPKIDVPS
jgi:methionyl-tRNA synthetase